MTRQWEYAIREFWRWRASCHLLKAMRALEHSGDAPLCAQQFANIAKTFELMDQKDVR